MALRNRFLVVDDHPIFRLGLAALLKSDPATIEVREACDIDEALRLLSNAPADLIILDLTLGQKNGLELVAILRETNPEQRIIVVSVHDEAVWALRALKAGARGYVMKEAAATDLLSAVSTVLAGRVWLSADQRERFIDNLSSNAETTNGDLVASLSNREMEVLQRLGKGFVIKEIADQLHISVKTVNVHQENLKTKLGCGSAAELRRFAIEWRSGA